RLRLKAGIVKANIGHAAMEPRPARTVKPADRRGASARLSVQDAGAAASVADLDILLDRLAVLIDGALQRALGARFVDGGQFARADAEALFQRAVGFDLLVHGLLDRLGRRRIRGGRGLG